MGEGNETKFFSKLRGYVASKISEVLWGQTSWNEVSNITPTCDYQFKAKETVPEIVLSDQSRVWQLSRISFRTILLAKTTKWLPKKSLIWRLSLILYYKPNSWQIVFLRFVCLLNGYHIKPPKDSCQIFTLELWEVGYLANRGFDQCLGIFESSYQTVCEPFGSNMRTKLCSFQHAT